MSDWRCFDGRDGSGTSDFACPTLREGSKRAIGGSVAFFLRSPRPSTTLRSTVTTPRDEYEARRRLALSEDERLDKRSALFGHARVVLVVLAIIFAIRAASSSAPQPWNAYLALVGLFVALLVPQIIIDRRRARSRRRAAFYAHAIDRLDGKWRSFPSTGASLADADHAYARDLDVVGQGSLFQLVDTTRTTQGEQTLGGWLLRPSPVAEVTTRIESVRTLVPELDARERIAVPEAEEPSVRVDERPLVAWGQSEGVFTLPLPVRALCVVLPFITIPMLWALNEGLVGPLVPTALLIGHAVLLKLTRRSVEGTARLAEQAERELVTILPLLEAAQTLPRSTDALARINDALAGAIDATRSLRRRVTLFQSRANLLVVPLVLLLFWDVHAAATIEAWRRRHGRSLGGWFAALGEAEALSSLATYAYEHPEDVWPELIDGPVSFHATGLGHPLLPLDRCVRNDVNLDGPSKVLLVTGSNMSGKSTLLRSVGLGAVMSLAGLPVRATRLRLPTLQVGTTMRVSDSLQEGASFFLAEVQRLKRISDLADGALPLLFLLDEILQGTNTRERSLGARGVIADLSNRGAAGLVSTHDLSLVQLGDVLGDRVAYSHFTDQVEGGEMTFDYRMREGIVQSSNALRLMRAVGLAVDTPEDG